jgi:Domain of unknown function (DUF1707)
MDRPELRASDSDRQAITDLLRASHLEGRLTVDELEDRVDRAQRAVTLGDLAALHADLPAPRPLPRRRRPPRAPGLASFTERVKLDAEVETARDQALTTIAPAMNRYGYVLTEHTRHSLLFTLRRRPTWTILVAVFLFPFGLLALTQYIEEEVAIDLEAGPGGGTILTARGVAPLAVRRAFALLED